MLNKTLILYNYVLINNINIILKIIILQKKTMAAQKSALVQFKAYYSVCVLFNWESKTIIIFIIIVVIFQ